MDSTRAWPSLTPTMKWSSVADGVYTRDGVYVKVSSLCSTTDPYAGFCVTVYVDAVAVGSVATTFDHHPGLVVGRTHDRGADHRRLIVRNAHIQHAQRIVGAVGLIDRAIGSICQRRHADHIRGWVGGHAGHHGRGRDIDGQHAVTGSGREQRRPVGTERQGPHGAPTLTDPITLFERARSPRPCHRGLTHTPCCRRPPHRSAEIPAFLMVFVHPYAKVITVTLPSAGTFVASAYLLSVLTAIDEGDLPT